MFLVTSPIVINMPTRTQLAVETMTSFVPWLANLNIKRNVTSMFVNKELEWKGRPQFPFLCMLAHSRRKGAIKTAKNKQSSKERIAIKHFVKAY